MYKKQLSSNEGINEKMETIYNIINLDIYNQCFFID